MYAVLTFVWFALERLRTVLLALAIIILVKTLGIMLGRLFGL